MPEGFSKPPAPAPRTNWLNNPAIKSFATVETPAATAITPPVPVAAKSVEVTPAPVATSAPEPEIQAPVKTPQEQYVEDLKDAKIPMDEAGKIIDAQISQGFYEEDIKITQKLSVRFRTREQDAADRLNAEITKQNPSFNGVLYSLVAKYNLAASLVRYGPHLFDPSTEQGFADSLSYVTKKIPLPLYQLLVTKLSKFDEKMSLVMREAAASFF